MLRQSRPGSYAIGTWAKPGAGAVRRRKGGGWAGAGLEIDDDDEEDSDEGVCWEERDSSSDSDDDELSGWFEDPPSLAHRQERIRNQEERAELSAFHSDELRRRQAEAALDGEVAGELELPREPGIEVLATAAGSDGSEDEMAIEPLGETSPVVTRAASMMPLARRASSGTPLPGLPGRAQSVAVLGRSSGVGRAHKPSPLGVHPSTTAAIRTSLSRLSCDSTPDIIIDDDDDDDDDNDNISSPAARGPRSVSPNLAGDRCLANLAARTGPVLAYGPSTSSPLRWMDVDTPSPDASSPAPATVRPPLSSASEDPLALTGSPAAGPMRCASAEAPLTNSPSRLLRNPTPFIPTAHPPSPPVSASSTAPAVAAEASPVAQLADPRPARPLAPTPSPAQPTPQPRRIRHSFALVIPASTSLSSPARRQTITAGERAEPVRSLLGHPVGTAKAKAARLAGHPTPSPSPCPDDGMLLGPWPVASSVSPRKRGRVSGGSPELGAAGFGRDESATPMGGRVFTRRASLRAASRQPEPVKTYAENSVVTPRQPARRPLTAAKTAPPRQRHSSAASARPPTPPSSKGAPAPVQSHRHRSPLKRRRSSAAPSSASLFQPSSGSGRGTPGPFRLLNGLVKEEWVEPDEREGPDDPLMLNVKLEVGLMSGRSSRRSSVGPEPRGGWKAVSSLVRSRSSPMIMGRVAEEESEDELALK